MAKKQISAKQIGKNIILIDGEEKLSKAIDNKEERIALLDKVKAYNEKNNATLLKQIKSALAAPVKKETKAKAEKPKVEVKIKKEVAKKVQAVKEAPKAPVTYSRRRGEY